MRQGTKFICHTYLTESIAFLHRVVHIPVRSEKLNQPHKIYLKFYNFTFLDLNLKYGKFLCHILKFMQVITKVKISLLHFEEDKVDV